jgi:hypothetical protein
MGGVAGCHTVPISSTKVSITSQIGAGRGAVRPGFERGRLVIANVAVQECRLGEFVRGGKTCRHEKAKDLLGKLIAKQGDQITCLGRGSCRSGGCDQAHDASAGGLPENACLCAHFVALPPSARDDHASRPAAYLSR